MLHDMQAPIDEPLATPVNPEKHKETRGPGGCPKFTHPRRCCPSPRRTYRPRTVVFVSQIARREPCLVLFKADKEHEVREPYLTDILVSHSANLLDVCRALGHSLERVASDGQLILLALGDLDVDTTLHGDPAHELLTDEVTMKSLTLAWASPPCIAPSSIVLP